ncbi:hypothetical protein BDK61_2624 [Haloarcula quadrata]|uniref:Uncharacterized protein n=1 Tax=Haloarcula quadrata TaxID=182779 RepID=A0A495R7N6_9EURY|nr:hypothetical protein BDK61_2624 [Haloarcula quadrata]
MIQDRNRTEPHDIDTNGLTDLFCQNRTTAAYLTQPQYLPTNC